MRLGILGLGRAGTYLARGFSACGHEIAALWDVNPGPAATAALETGAAVRSPLLWSDLRLDAVLLAVPDGAIAEAAEAMAQGSPPAAVALHLSGACAASELAPLQAIGCAIGSMHPLRSFAAPESLSDYSLCGTRFALQGDAKAVSVGRLLAESVGGVAFEIGSAQKTSYHAAASVCSNYLVVLAWLARDIALASGVPSDAWEGYLELMRGTLENIATFGPEKALTGPVVRGDWQTVVRHLDALSAQPSARQAYRCMGRTAASLAHGAQLLSDEQFVRLSRILEGEMDDEAGNCTDVPRNEA